MNVRFFAGTKADYLSLPAPRNPLGLYFCEDTKELFWADRLLTDGTRIVATEADLPNLENAADGITYYVEKTRNGYVLSSDRTEWIKVIQAPDAGSPVKAISFAGIEMEEVDGVFTIDRRCAREALGFIVPEGLQDEDIEIVTKEYVNEKITQINIPDTSTFVTNEQFTSVQQQVENIQNTYITEEHLEQKNYVTEQFVTNNYVTNETIEANYSTTEKIAQTYVSNNDVNEIVTNQVTEVINQKIEDGNLVVNADAINYDTW